jgi:putative PEP-CTERM system TPR-repeat lipoprotein
MGRVMAANGTGLGDFLMVRRFLGVAATAIALTGGLATGVFVPTVPAFAATGDESDAFLQDAKKYMQKGDVNAAVIQLKNALQKDPANVGARKMLGEIYLRTGNGPSAEKELKAAKRRGATDKDIDILIARAYLLQGKYRDVLKELKDDVSDPKRRADTLLTLVRAHLGLGEFDAAAKSSGEAEKLQPDDVRPKVGLAQGLVNQAKLKEAEAKVDEALAIKKDSPEALVLKGELRRLSKDLPGAVKAFDSALEKNKNNLPALLGRAASLVDLNKDDAAQADLQAVFRRVPKHPLASYLSALILAKKKDFAGAQEALQQAGPLLDNHMPSVFLRGAITYALNQLEQAASSLERYVAAVPGNTKARKLLGATLVRKNQPQKAIEILTPLLNTPAANAQVLALMGSASMRVGKYNEGTEYFQKAAEAAPDQASIRTQLALSHLATGASEKAVGDLEAAVGLDPDARQASVLLTLVRLRKGEFDAALQSAQGLRKSMPDNPLPDNLIGAAYLGKGDLAKARETFERALKTKPEFHPARMNLAQLDLGENKVGDAIKQYESIVEKDPKHVGAMLALADIAVRQKKDEGVLKWLQQASEANPKSPVPKLRLVQYYGQNRDFRKAVAVARELNGTVPNEPRVLEALGQAEVAAGDGIAAVSTFRRLVALAPKAPRAYALLAGAQAASNDRGEARSNYEKALELDANYIPAYMALVELESREGNPEKALKLAATLKEKQPKAAVGDMLTGDVHMRAKAYGKAVAAYEDALKKEDTGVLAIRRFNAQRQAGQGDQALANLQGWVDRKEDRAVRHVLASSYISAQKYDAAIRESEKLLGSDKSNPVLLNNLAWLYDQKGDKRALDYAEQAMKQAPKSPAVMDTLGWILVRQGKNDRAADILGKAHQAAPKQGDIAYHYAVALKNLDRKREAVRTLQRTLQEGDKFFEAANAKKLLQELGG